MSFDTARAITDAATAGEWKHVHHHERYENPTGEQIEYHTHTVVYEDGLVAQYDGDEPSPADAMFIAWARNVMPATLDALEAAEEVARREDWTDPSWASPLMMAKLDSAIARVKEQMEADR